MALFDTKTAQTNNTETPAADRPKAQLWLNVGVMLDVQQEDGTMKPEFISLPVGIPLDTTNEMEAKGNNQKWRKTVQVKNALLKFAQETAANLEAGTGDIIENFQVQAFHIADQAASEPSPESNDMLAQMQTMFAPKVAANG